MRKITALLLIVLSALSVSKLNAQIDISYQMPPAEILELADAPMNLCICFGKPTSGWKNG